MLQSVNGRRRTGVALCGRPGTDGRCPGSAGVAEPHGLGSQAAQRGCRAAGRGCRAVRRGCRAAQPGCRVSGPAPVAGRPVVTELHTRQVLRPINVSVVQLGNRGPAPDPLRSELRHHALGRGRRRGPRLRDAPTLMHRRVPPAPRGAAGTPSDRAFRASHRPCARRTDRAQSCAACRRSVRARFAVRGRGSVTCRAAVAHVPRPGTAPTAATSRTARHLAHTGPAPRTHWPATSHTLARHFAHWPATSHSVRRWCAVPGVSRR